MTKNKRANQARQRGATLSTALVALAAACWGLSGGIGGILMAGGWNASVVAFYRGAIGLLLVLGWLALRPGRSGLADHRLWFWAAVAGLGVAGNFSFYFVSISEGSVAVAATLMYCAPVIVYLLSFGLGIESPTRRKWAAIGVVFVGIVLLTRAQEAAADAVTATGIAAGLAAGLSYAVFIFGFKYAARHGSPQGVLAVAFAVLVAVLVWTGDVEQALAVPSTPDWPLFILLGVLGAGLSFACYVVGLSRTAPTVASVVALVEPVTAALFGVAALGERLAAPQILGMVLILLTVAALSLSSPNRGR